MTLFLSDLFIISAVMSLIIAAVLLFGKLMKKRFSATCRYTIWTVIIIRLCIPFGIFGTEKAVNIPYEPYTPKFSAPAASDGTRKDTDIPEPSLNAQAPVTGKSLPFSDTPSSPIETESKAEFKLEAETVEAAVFGVWLLSAVILFMAGLIKNAVTVLMIDRTLISPREETLKVYEQICSEIEIKRAPRLYESRFVGSPIMYGFFRPKVVLPSLELSKKLLLVSSVTS